MKRIKVKELNNIPKLSEEELESIKNFKNTDFSDCPPLTSKNFANARKSVEAHPEWYAVKKKDIHIRLDADLLEWFKAQGAGYQTRINEILRYYYLQNTKDM